jgi:hypothetical protein
MWAVLVDYFRAPERATAVRIGRRGLTEGRPLDGIRTGIEPEVELAMFLALALDRRWDLDLLRTETVWPRRRIWRSRYDGPHIAQLPASSGPQFARIPDDLVPELVTRWAQIEEFSPYSDIRAGDYTYLEQVAAGMIGLARRAEDAGDKLYVWTLH